jgi:hypothetical protein
MLMEIKTVTRNLNFDEETRNSSSPYRVRYGDPSAFQILKVICNGDGETQIFETDSSNLPSYKDSIHFLADKIGNSFNIRWRGEAASFMKRVD